MSLALDGTGGYTVSTDQQRASWWTPIRASIGRHGAPRTLWTLVAGAPRPRVARLKPSGYNALIERLTQPMLVIASIALTTGAVFVMAQGLIGQASDAIGAGQLPSFQNLLALGTLFVIGFLIDTSLITSGSRFRMHALRHEWGWATLSAVALLLCVAVEGMTWSYLLYELEPSVLPTNVASFIRSIPGALFFVRAYMGPICLIYLTAGVLPLTIQRGDVDRQTAADTGAAIVTVLQELVAQMREKGFANVGQLVQLLGLLFPVFRLATKNDTATDDDALVAAMRDLTGMFTDSAAQPALALAAPAANGVTGVTPEALETALRESVDALRGEIADKMTSLEGLVRQFLAERSTLTETTTARRDTNQTAAIAMRNSVASSGAGERVRQAPPLPGDPGFPRWVYTQAKAILRDGQPLNLLALSARTGHSVAAVQGAIAQLREDRTRKLRPGASNLSNDPVLSNPTL